MSAFLSWLNKSALCAALSLISASVASAQTAPKNVIVFIGDGMGFEQVEAAGFYFYGQSGQYNFEQFPGAAAMTHNNSSNALTDSAASGTAIATGFKVDNGVISVGIASGSDPRSAPNDGSELQTLLEQLKAAGKSTGLVTTSYMTDATPAAFGAHDPSRSNSASIANDYFVQTRPNVLFGSGASGFTSTAATSASYVAVTSRSQMQALNTGTTTHAAGIFGTNGFAYAYDQSIGASTFYNSNPYLHEMTQTALDILDNDPDGFFLMVENELIDSSGHSTTTADKIKRNIFEVNELAKAVQTALTWAAGRTDTLIIVTADHETGGLMTVTNNGQNVFPTVTWAGTSHTHSPVPFYAWGVNAGHAEGTKDNTDVKSIATTTAAAPAPAVVFRQGKSGYSGAKDTMVRENNATTSYATDAKLTVDQDDPSGTALRSQSLVRFDSIFGTGAGQVPLGATITSAKLTIYTGIASNDQSNSTISAHRMLTTWSETSTWNSLSSGISANGSEAASSADDMEVPSSLGGAAIFDVTSSVQAWSSGATNHGWALLSNGNDGWWLQSSDFGIKELRPTLSITYTTSSGSSIAAYEGFNYTGSLNTQNGGSGFGTNAWTAVSGWTNPAIATGTMAYTDSTGKSLIVSGNKLQPANNSRSVRNLPTANQFVPTSGSTLWVSFRINHTGTSSLPSNHAGFALYSTLNADSTGDELFLGNPGFSGQNWGFNPEGGTRVVAPGTVTTGAPRDVLLLYKLQYGTSSAAISMWINPDLNEASLGTPDATGTQPGLDPVRSILFSAGSSSSGYQFDELRLGTTFASVCPSTSVLIASENFNYTGSLNTQNGGNGWGGAWTAVSGSTNPALATGSMAYTDSAGNTLLVSGNKLQPANSSRSVRNIATSNQFVPTNGSVLWMSFRINHTGTSTLPSNHAGFALYSTENATTAGDEFFMGNPGFSGQNWGFNPEGGTRVVAPGTVSGGAPRNVLLLYKLAYGASSAAVSMWINPNITSESALGTPQATGTQPGLDPVRSVIISTGSSSTGYQFDEMRIGTTFDSVTPK